MERPTFEAMLEAAAGVERDGDQYSVADGYGLSVFIGEPGQAMEVSEVEALRLSDGFIEARSREHHQIYYLEYSSLHGLRVRPPNDAGGRRAGFN
jgi:hypothetical protein